MKKIPLPDYSKLDFITAKGTRARHTGTELIDGKWIATVMNLETKEFVLVPLSAIKRLINKPIKKTNGNGRNK